MTYGMHVIPNNNGNHKCHCHKEIFCLSRIKSFLVLDRHIALQQWAFSPMCVDFHFRPLPNATSFCSPSSDWLQCPAWSMTYKWSGAAAVPCIIMTPDKTLTAHGSPWRHYIKEIPAEFSVAFNWAVLWFASMAEVDNPKTTQCLASSETPFREFAVEFV